MVIMNKSIYGEMKSVLKRSGATHDIGIPPLHFARTAESFSGVGVERESELEGAYVTAFASGEPVVIDVLCGSNVAFPSLP